MIKRYLIVAAGLALAGVSTTSLATDASGGGFFVNGNVGQSRYNANRRDWSDRNDTAAAIRFGYRWHGAVDFGVEGGYVDLGKLRDRINTPNYSFSGDLKVKGFLLGVNGKYHFGQSGWYLSARGGWFGTRADYRAHASFTSSIATASYSVSDSISSTNGGWYAGVGAGYDLNSHFSVGVSYDNYHAKARVNLDIADETISGNVRTISAFAEYRF